MFILSFFRKEKKIIDHATKGKYTRTYCYIKHVFSFIQIDILINKKSHVDVL
jgi:hypothetical protein